MTHSLSLYKNIVIYHINVVGYYMYTATSQSSDNDADLYSDDKIGYKSVVIIYLQIGIVVIL